jgi:hypothetical protein
VGATWQLPGLRKYLKQQLGLDVYRIETFKKIGTGGGGMGEGGDDEETAAQTAAVDPNDRNAQFNRISLEMTTAYGLALQGLGLNAVSGNLMPVSIVRKSMWNEKGKWFGLAAGVAAAAAGVMFLNPLRQHFAVGAAQDDPAIQQTIRQASQLRAQAEEAKVTNPGEPDFRAANILALQNGKGAYQYVVRDLHAMFASAEARKGSWAKEVAVPGQPEAALAGGPALRLLSVSTEYFGPVAATPAADGTQAAEPWIDWTEEEKAMPRIEVTLSCDTALPEPRKFFSQAVQQWLRDNKIRADIPYELVYRNTFLLEVTGEEVAAAPTGVTGEGRATSREESAMARRLGRQTGSKRAGDQAGVRLPRNTAAPRRPAGEGSMSGQDADDLAPLEAPAGLVAAPTGNATFVFGLLFKPPAKPGDEAANGGAQ